MFGLDPCPWDIGQFGDNVIVLEVVNEGALSVCVYKLAVHLQPGRGLLKHFWI